MKHIVLFITLITFSVTSQAREVWKDIDRIVVVGDVHGDYEAYEQVLKQSEVINDSLDWIGGRTHLVQIGDISDRGPDTLKIARHLMKLEKQARRAKGRVHVLIGNHEMMNITGDLRFVHPGEYEAFVTEDSEALQQDYTSRVLAWMMQQDPSLEGTEAELIEKLKKQYPLGYVEHRRAWTNGGELYRWITKLNAVVQINDLLFVHAGLNPHVEPMTLKAINRKVRASLKSTGEPDPILLDDGPLWYRGLARGEEATELEPLKQLLDYYEVGHVVIGHTPSLKRIRTRFDDRVIITDTGMSAHYGGVRTSLIIEYGEFFVNHNGTRLTLPLKESDRPAYIEQIKALNQ